MDTDKNYEFLMGIKSSFSLDESGSSSSAEDKAVRRQVALLISSYKTSDSRKFEADVKQFLDEGTIPPTINKQDVKSDSTGSGTAIPPGVTLEKHLENLQHLIELNNVHPEPEDIAGEEIDFTNLMDFSELEKIPRKLEGFLKWRIAFQQKQANSMLKQYSEKYGYQPLFRKAIREYFTTRDLLGLSNPFWGYRRRRFNTHAQELCAQAINEFPWLNNAEKTVVVQASHCFPQDAEQFWRWITKNRLSYLSLIAMLQDPDHKFTE
ncbi:hypothetical protein DIZ76_012121 [Coccidioides immitis]|nr:hypothetical protein DIZ76_012121 [Coccidioides immitis]